MIPLLAFLPGCSEPAAPPTATVTPALSIPAPSLPIPETRGPVEAAAKAFLRSVSAGTASPKDLSPNFKKVIAPPVFDLDKAQGYSDDRAELWLKSLTPNASAASVACPLATNDLGFVVAGAPNGRTLLRLVKHDHEWLIDWCQNTAAQPMFPGSPSATNAEEAGAWFAAAAFVESIGQGQLAAAESLLTPAAKAKLSPPIFEADNAPGYNRSKLPEELRKLVVAGSAVAAFRLQPSGSGFTGHLEWTSGSTLTLSLTRGTARGEWKVGDIQAGTP
jgi:hypothetical protein